MGVDYWAALTETVTNKDYKKMEEILDSGNLKKIVSLSSRYRRYYDTIKNTIVYEDTRAALLILHSAFNDQAIAGYLSGTIKVQDPERSPLWLYAYCMQPNETSALLSYGVGFKAKTGGPSHKSFILHHMHDASGLAKLTVSGWDYTSPTARPLTIEKLHSEMQKNVNLLEILAKERIFNSIKEESDVWKLPLPLKILKELSDEKMECNL